jgi:hypothetical protein
MRRMCEDKFTAGDPSLPACELLDAEAMHARLKHYGFANILENISMIQGATLALAAVALVEMLSRDAKWVAWLMWAVSVTGINAIYVAYVRAAIIEPEDGRFGQTALTLVGMCEMLQFALLARWRGHPEQTYLDWLIVTFVGGVLLIWEGRNRSLRLEHRGYAGELAELAQAARVKGGQRIFVMTAVVIVMALAIAAIALWALRGGALDAAAAAPAAIFGAVTIGMTIHIYHERISMMRKVHAILNARTAQPP